MNYERVMSTRHDNRKRHDHHVIPGTLRTLCGKQLTAQWWKPGQRGLLCRDCQRIHRTCQYTTLSATDEQVKRRYVILDKIGHKLNLSPRQYQICVAMKNSAWMPKQIEEATGIARSVIRAQMQQLCSKHGINTADLRLVLPYIVLSDPSKRRPKPYVRCQHNGWTLECYGDYLGTWDTEEQAYDAGLAYIAGRPFPTPPRKFGQKPMVMPRKNGSHHVYVYDRETKKRRYVCACSSKEEGVAVWENAKRNGVYTSKGFVKPW